MEQPNQLAFPQFDDLEAMVREFKEHAGPARLMMAFDIKAAHRLVPIHPQDWGLQACRLEEEEEIYLNARGTFGVASAAFWWGRVAGVASRVFHRILEPQAIFCLLLFADDGLILSGGGNYHRNMIGLFMEIPLSWSKTRGGHKVEWIGYNVDIQSWRLGVSEKKVEWMKSWTQLALSRADAGAGVQSWLRQDGLPCRNRQKSPAILGPTLCCVFPSTRWQLLRPSLGGQAGYKVL